MSRQPPDDFITVHELARRLRVHPRTIQRLVQRKELNAIKVGRQWRIRREWLRDWLDRSEHNHEIEDDSA